MKSHLKPAPCRSLTWWRHGDSRRVQRLWIGMKDDPVCSICGEPYTAHGWLEGVGIVHPGDSIVDLPGQVVVLRPDTAAAILEDADEAAPSA